MKLFDCQVICVAIVAFASTTVAMSQGGQVQWTHLSSTFGDIPTPPGGLDQTVALVGDLNNDGQNDFIIGSRGVSNSVVGYLGSGATWSLITIEAGSLAPEAGGALFDIDSDGDLDIVLGQDYSGPNVWWWENPFPNIDPSVPWTRRLIKDSYGKKHHDQAFGDFDGDGTAEFATWITSELRVRIYEIPATPLGTSPWPDFVDVSIAAANPEGMDVKDIDRDGKVDLIVGGFWLRHEGGDNYTPMAIDPGYTSARTLAGDFIPGGYLEVFQNSGDADGPFNFYTFDGTDWNSTTLIPLVQHGHSLEAGDFNRDGNLDVFTAEMGSPGAGANARMWIGWGDGAGGFTLELISTGLANHMSRAADLDGDSDLDLLIKPFTFGSPRIDIFLGDPVVLPLDQWRTHLLDPLTPWQPFFVAGGDVDNDGLGDVITGGWWYRNPGDPSASWVRKSIGSPLHNMVVVRDFDDDGDLDVLGSKGAKPSDDFSEFFLAVNDGGGNFSIQANGSSLPGKLDFFQGVASGVFAAGGPDQVVLSWMYGEQGKSGIELLTVPSQLDSTTIHPISQGEGLSVGDIDGDGDLDVYQGTRWLRNDAGIWTSFQSSTIGGDGTAVGIPDRNRLVDMDLDGDLDAVVGFAHFSGSTNDLYWFENPTDSTLLWPVHTVAQGVAGGWSLDAADMDRDGDVDVVLGEHYGNGRVLVFENDGAGASFTQHLVDPGGAGVDHHGGTRLVDIDRDGDLDIISIGWFNDKVWLFENLGFDGTQDPPAAPTGLMATALTDTLVWLDWDDNTEPTLDSYSVYRSTISGFVADASSQIASGVSTSEYYDATAVALQTYYYVVTAWNTLGMESSQSAEVSVTMPPDSSPPVIIGVNAYAPSIVSILFSESVDVLTASDAANYAVSAGVTVSAAALGLDGRTVTLTTSTLSPNTTYTLTVNDVEDLVGNAIVPNSQATFTPAIGVVAHWPFDEGAGATAADSSGNGQTGTLTNGASWTAGARLNAVDLDGANDFVDVGMIDVSGSAMTLAAWFNSSQLANTPSNDGRIISKAQGTAESKHFWMLSTIRSGSDTRLRFRLKAGGKTTTLVASSGNLTENQWFHAAAVYDGASMKLYLDGVLVGSLNKTGAIAVSSSVPVWIGGNPTDPTIRPWQGAIDDVRIYDRALSAAEVLALIGNAPPVAVDDTLVTDEDTAARIVLQGSDPDGDALTFSILSGPVSGMLSGVPPTLTYVPNTDFNGTDGFVFQVDDGNGGTDTGTVSITVDAVNDLPVAQDQTVATDMDVPLAITLVAIDVDSDPLSYAIRNAPTSGTLSGTPPQVTYTPNPGFSGGDTFTFVANDGTGDGNEGTVVISVDVTNSPPVATDASLFTDEDTPSRIVLEGTDPDGDPLTFSILVGPTSGALSGTPPAVTYAPYTNFNGGDSFIFQVDDGKGGTDSGTVTVTVNPINDAPIAQDQSVGATVDTAQAITLVATDIENDPLTYSIGTAPASGTLSGTPPQVTYTPNLGFVGQDAFTFTASDGSGVSNEATISITVTSQIFAHWPFDEGAGTTAADVSGNGHTGTLTNGATWATGVLSNAVSLDGVNDYVDVGAIDIAGNAMTLAGWFNSNHLAITTYHDGRIISKATGTAEADHYWMLSTIRSGSKSRLRFRLKTGGVTDTLIASSGNLTENQWFHAAAVYDGVTMKLYLDGTLVGTRSKAGSIAVGGNVSVWIGGNPTDPSVRPWQGAIDDVRIYDRALSAGEIMGLTGNAPPVAVDDALVTDEDARAGIVLQASDADGDPLSFSILSNPKSGTLSGVPPIVTYSPDPDYYGGDAFTFQVDDGKGGTDTGTITVTVNPVNDAPIAQDQGVGATVDTAQAITLVATDVESDPLTYSIGMAPASGTLSGTPPQVTYTPNLGFLGQDAFTFTASDGAGVSNEATVSITVTSSIFAHWPFDEGAGTTAADVSGNGYTGTLSNGAAWTTGKLSNAVSLDGVNDYVDVGIIDVAGNAMTLAGWINSSDLAVSPYHDGRIISKATGTAEAKHYWMMSTIKSGSKSRLRFRLKAGGSTTTLVASSGNLTENQWFHGAAVYDGATMKLYLDGVLVGTRSKTGSIAAGGTVPVWIGGNPTDPSVRPWQGAIDDVRIYDRALSAAEVAALAGG
jgi:hypothetical protein